VLAGAQPGSPEPGSDAASTEAVRSSRAQILLLGGAWPDALEEARRRPAYLIEAVAGHREPAKLP